MVDDLLVAAEERSGAEFDQIFAVIDILHDLFAFAGLKDVCKEFQAG